MITKSSIMLGLGEYDEEVKEAMQDLRAIGVDILTLGQYLQPTPLLLTVKEYVTPEKFSFWKEYGESIVPFIKSHRLYGHLNGTTPVPPEWIMQEVKNAAGQVQETVAEVNLEYETWMAHDQSLVAYITSTLSEEVLAGVDEDLSALELWNVLATTYSQVSEARFLQLKRQFQDIKHGTRSVLEYIHEIKNVSDQLAIIGHPVSDKDKLISQKLNHSNYLTQKRQIVPFIKSHILYGHIDGTTPAPPQYIDREVKRTVVADQGGGASAVGEIRFEYETVTENNPTYEAWLAHDQSLVAYITSTLSEEVMGGVDDDLTALE
ncbi:hypothetical protein EJ110_NYTH59923 [Nymphaea thermarum]|nr:hypothetical protein EJ110_NYTH59923 [Nymphaea thermarum]